MTEKRIEPVEGIVAAVAPGLVLSVTGSATAKTRPGFALPHIRAAEHFAGLLRTHEAAHEGAPFGPPFDMARWYASAAILLSFSAIEAGCDEAEDSLSIPDALHRTLQRAPFWERVAAVLAFRGIEQIDRGAEPFQSTDLLRDLRNGLAHPKAEWGDEDAPDWRRTHKRLCKRVLGAGLPLSPFLQDPTTAFPYGCMSAGVAEWAAGTARAFVGELRQRLGLSRIT
jgi:hypothetical protein